MTTAQQNRRDFLKATTAALATSSMPYWYWNKTASAAYKFQAANDRPVVGCIGTGSRWNSVGPAAMQFGDCVAVCDVDSNHAGQAREKVKKTQGKRGVSADVDVYEDYRKIIDRDDIDIVTIVTTDHWHTKIAIEALKAGKDVYCEKPLTLTIEEGKQIRQTVDATKRVFQVGTQQRSEFGLRFLQAMALVREGRLGKITNVQCAIGGAPTSDSLPIVDPPAGLNWEMWLGQAPLVKYRAGEKGDKRRAPTRGHYEFRWWYEYSGGKLTDWGAHHVDIAQWAIDQNGPGQGPLKVIPEMFNHPVPLKDGYPTLDDRYNVADKFLIRCEFADDVEMIIRHDTDNGVMITGTEGRVFVNRGKISGKPVEDLASNPLPDDAITKVYKGKEPGSHMGNFFECVMTREQPISDVHSHHRALTTCHLANIAMRLNRSLTWDPQTEQIVGDPEANAWQTREQRKGYEIKV